MTEQLTVGDLIAVLLDVEDTLHHVVGETESRTFGKPSYDMTMDDIHDVCVASLDCVRQTIQGYYVADAVSDVVE